MVEDNGDRDYFFGLHVLIILLNSRRMEAVASPGGLWKSETDIETHGLHACALA